MKFCLSYKKYSHEKLSDTDTRYYEKIANEYRELCCNFEELEKLFEELIKVVQPFKYICSEDLHNIMDKYTIGRYEGQIDLKIGDFKSLTYAESDKKTLVLMNTDELMNLISDILDEDKLKAYYGKMLYSIVYENNIPSEKELYEFYISTVNDKNIKDCESKRVSLRNAIKKYEGRNEVINSDKNSAIQ